MQDRINQVDETSCIARPDHTVGSKAALRHVGFNVWFARKETSTAVIRVTGFMERHLGMADHSGLMFAARITLPHFCVSSAMSLPKSAGEPGSIVPPRSASRAFMFGSIRAAFISLLSFSTISGDVFLGAPTPNQVLVA